MELQLRTATLNAETSREWSELLLGRRKDSGTGLSWDTGLLQRLQSHTQNFLMLAWRARAAQLLSELDQVQRLAIREKVSDVLHCSLVCAQWAQETCCVRI